MSSSNKLTLVCLVAAASLIVVASLAVSQVRAEDAMDGLKEILEKLEAFANRPRSIVSMVSFDELMNVARAYEQWTPEQKAEVRKSPALHLVTDFAINPMKLIAFQIEADPRLFAGHLLRVEEAYKRFRPAYMGQQIGDKRFKIKVNRSMKLYNILSGNDLVSKLTLKHFLDARAESNTWRARLEELTTEEDIFASLTELESIFNYFNAPVFKPLFETIFPNLRPNSDIDQLSAQYHKQLWEGQGIKFVRGTPTLFRGAGGPQAQAAGFTHVVTA